MVEIIISVNMNSRTVTCHSANMSVSTRDYGRYYLEHHPGKCQRVFTDSNMSQCQHVSVNT